jgi:hypothetical protein
MSGNEAHVKSFEIDVVRDRCAPVGAITRCVSVADTSLSLSLSLSTIGFLAPRVALFTIF